MFSSTTEQSTTKTWIQSLSQWPCLNLNHLHCGRNIWHLSLKFMWQHLSTTSNGTVTANETISYQMWFLRHYFSNDCKLEVYIYSLQFSKKCSNIWWWVLFFRVGEVWGVKIFRFWMVSICLFQEFQIFSLFSELF